MTHRVHGGSTLRFIFTAIVKASVNLLELSPAFVMLLVPRILGCNIQIKALGISGRLQAFPFAGHGIQEAGF